MKFRPCIDLHDGKVKQIVGSTLNEMENPTTNFISSKPSEYYAELYKNDNLTGGHIIMLGKNNEQAAINALKTYPSGLQIGGGLNDSNGECYLDAGASHLIFTSFVFNDGIIEFARLENLVKRYGKKKIVLDLSCRKKNDGNYYIVTNRWQKFTNAMLNRDSFYELAQFADEFLIHAVDVEGKQSGIDSELLDLIVNNSPITTVYAGGISKLDDIDTIKRKGKEKLDFTIGSALDIFGGHLKYTDIVKIATKL